MKNRLIVGCGFVGRELSIAFSKDDTCKVYTLARKPRELPANIIHLQADVCRLQAADLPVQFDEVFYMVGAASPAIADYRAAYIDGLQQLCYCLSQHTILPKLIYVASTGIYSQQQGEWVDELTPPQPQNEKQQILWQAENIVKTFSQTSIIVRSGGIYAESSCAKTIARLRAHDITIPINPTYVNRIHRDDLVQLLMHITTLQYPQALYCAVDDEPLTQLELYQHICDKWQIPLPAVSVETPSRGSKRIRNRLIKSTGFTFIYPNAKIGYDIYRNQQV